MTFLEVRHVTKHFRRGRRQPATVAVEDVSFDVEIGMTLAVVGESGAGKSTLGRLVARLVDPDSGSIKLDGEDLLSLSGKQLRHARRRVQMVFQDPFNSLDPRIPIGRSIAEPLKIHLGLSRAERELRAVQLLERVGLSRQYLHRLPREMSGGQLQRVAIARALGVEPQLIVCDEPVAALDASVRAQVINLLLDLQQTDNVSYIFVTHDLSTVRVFAHDMLVMDQGRCVESGRAKDVFDSPTSPYTKNLLESIPTLRLDGCSSPGTGDGPDAVGGNQRGPGQASG